MTLNDAHGLLQNLISTPMIDGLPLVEGKKVQKLSQVNQERPFEFTMNTSTWFKKCFNQDFIFCKYMLPSEYELFIFMSLFWARLFIWPEKMPNFPCQVFKALFDLLQWHWETSASEWALAETPLFLDTGGSDTWNFEVLTTQLLNFFS